MSLQGSIAGLQDNIAQLYLELEHRFTENHMIRDLWGAMAHDISEQSRGLKALPNSFWTHIRNDGTLLSEADVKSAKQQVTENCPDQSLRSCFERALLVEEATILKLYTPIIRNLRRNWTDHALDFYIMVKAHLARIVRVTESFCGDPVIIQQAHELLRNFEKEVQEQEAPPKPLRLQKASPKTQAAVRAGSEKKQAEKPARETKANRSITKHVPPHHNRTKPIVEKVPLQRRRARTR